MGRPTFKIDTLGTWTADERRVGVPGLRRSDSALKFSTGGQRDKIQITLLLEGRTERILLPHVPKSRACLGDIMTPKEG